jgi:hypothetical protein
MRSPASGVARTRVSRCRRTWSGALVLVAPCATVSGQLGNPAAPILVKGQVEDESGRGRAGAELQLVVFDDQPIPIGQIEPTIFEATFTPNEDGKFAIHLEPTGALLQFAAERRGYLDFEIVVSAGYGPSVPYSFSRQWHGAGWADAIPVVLIGPQGFSDAGARDGQIQLAPGA